MNVQVQGTDVQTNDKAIRKLARISTRIDGSSAAAASVEDNDLDTPLSVPDDDSKHTPAHGPTSITSASFANVATEIRLMIYDSLFEKSVTIHITKCTRWTPRAVQQSFHDNTDHYRHRLRWRDLEGKWTGQKPSPSVLAPVSRKVAAEVVPAIYAGKAFELEHAGDLDMFIKCVGGAISLAKAVELRSLLVDDRYVTELHYRPHDSKIVHAEYLVHRLMSILHAHRRAQQEKASGRIDTRGVAELVKIEPRNGLWKDADTRLCCYTPYIECASWRQDKL